MKLPEAFLMAGLTCLGLSAQPAAVFYNARSPQIAFAASEIRRAFAPGGISQTDLAVSRLASNSSSLRLVLVAGPAEAQALARSLGVAPLKSMSSQSYAIRRQEKGGRVTIAVLAADAVGAMYGGLDLAEAVRLKAVSGLKDSDHTPHIAERGIKFNISLDRRTPTYSDNSDSAQANIPEMWSMDFWRAYFDEMARNRYNVLSLWSLHPFPSIVKVPEYPEVALNDVWGNREKFDLNFEMNSHLMAQPFALNNVAVVKKMTIEEKIRFWRDVMQCAKDRGIDIYWFTWNIFVWGTEGKYGLTEDGNNPSTIAYFRASVRETVKTYPLLAGMGITAGENMKSAQGPFDHEAWLWHTYGEGIRDALKDQPNRQFRLIHRYHQTAQTAILNTFKDYPGPFDFSFKYSVAHMYSETNPPFIAPVLEEMPKNMRTWLTVRDDDIYSYRWGDPDFARDYVRHIPGPDRVTGFYMGPDGYCWGREFIDREPETPRQLVMQKLWYTFMLWGRLSYDPDLPDSLFEQTLGSHFPGAPAAKVYQALSDASKIIPQVTRFFWRDLDTMWFPEACIQRGNGSGFFTVKDFANGQVMPGSGILNIRQWRSRFLKGTAMEGITPLQVAAALRGSAASALRLVAELRPLQGDNKELRLTLGDAEAMAHLGNYYADKIVAASDLALFDQDGKSEHKISAIAHLEAALAHWKKYAAVATSQYMPQNLGRLARVVDLNELTSRAEADIGVARDWRQGSVRDDGEGPIKGDTNFRK